MIVYCYDHLGFYLGWAEADPSPREPGKFLIPARCTTSPPPTEAPEGHLPRWNGEAWEVAAPPPPPPPEPPPFDKLEAFLAERPDAQRLIDFLAENPDVEHFLSLR